MNKFRDLIVNDINEAKVILVGLPYDESCSVGVGASKAPNTLRDLSKHLPPFTMNGKSIKECKIYDYGNIESCENYHFVVEEKLKDIYSYNKFPLFIGGDHSVSIPIQKNFFNYLIMKGALYPPGWLFIKFKKKIGKRSSIAFKIEHEDLLKLPNEIVSALTLYDYYRLGN